jgi:hypothetical protein
MFFSRISILFIFVTVVRVLGRLAFRSRED